MKNIDYISLLSISSNHIYCYQFHSIDVNKYLSYANKIYIFIIKYNKLSYIYIYIYIIFSEK